MSILNMKKESRNAIDLKWHNISIVKPCKLVCVCIYTRCLCYLVVTLLTTCTFVCISIGWHKKPAELQQTRARTLTRLKSWFWVMKMHLHLKLVEPCITLSTKITLLWIWFCHIGSFCFSFTYISETVLQILSKFATFLCQSEIKVPISIIDSDKF